MASSEGPQVKFGGDVSGLNSAVQEALSKLGEFGAGVTDVSENLGNIKDAIISAFAIDKLEEFTKSMAELGEEVEHTAAMTGLSVESVQNFQNAVKSTGGSAQQADLALVRLERNISEAAQGIGQAGDAFTRLGVSQEELKRGDINEIMRTMASTMHDTADGANKVEAMYRAVGRSGAQLIPIFDLGGKAIDEMNAKFRATGAQISEDFAQKLTLMAQQLYLSESATQGLGNAIMGVLLPAVNAANIGLTQMKEETSQNIQQGGMLASTLKFLGEIMMYIVEGAKTLAAAFEIMAAKATASFDAIVDRAQGLYEFLTKFATGDYAGAFEAYKTAGVNASADVAAGVTKVDQITQKLTDDIQHMKDVYEGVEQVGIGLGRGNPNNKFGDPKKQDNSKADDSTQRQMLAEHYAVTKEYDDLEVQSGQMSHKQELQDLEQALTAEETLTAASFEKEMAQYKEGSNEYKKLLDQKEIADQKFLIEHMKLQQAQAKDDAKVWTDALSTINKSFDTMLQGILMGTQTMGQVFQRMAQNMVIAFTEGIAKMMLQWAVFQSGVAGTAVKNPFGGSSSAGGGAFDKLTGVLLSLIGIETTSEGDIAVNSIAVGAETAALAANTAALSASSVSGGGGGGGPLGMIGSTGGVAAMFAEGTPSVPHNMVAGIHAGEMILPAHIAAGIRGGGSINGGGGGDSTHFHVSAMDSRDVKNFFAKHGKMISKTLASHARSGNTRASIGSQ